MNSERIQYHDIPWYVLYFTFGELPTSISPSKAGRDSDVNTESSDVQQAGAAVVTSLQNQPSNTTTLGRAVLSQRSLLYVYVCTVCTVCILRD